LSRTVRLADKDSCFDDTNRKDLDMLRMLLGAALLTLAACTDPMLSAEMAVGSGGVSVKPTLSGSMGDATVYVQPN
jgi:hypothetical protein